MKLTTLILITAILHLSASSLAQKVTLVEKNAQLIDVFGHIRSQTGYDFIYAGSDLKNLKPVTISVTNEELTTVLNKLFEGQPLQYTIEDKLVTVKEKETSTSLIDKIKAQLAQVTITGKVQDETGQPLPGVNVRVKNSTTGTTTDKNGAYAINAPDDKSIIVFSYTGYETQELQAKDIAQGSIITLKASITGLKEVVINKGYYKEKQELSTGNAVRISGEDIQKQPVSDPMMALEGRVAGLSITQGSGIPGANLTINIRGRNSIANGNQPFYVVDGVPFSSTSFSSPYAQKDAFGGVGQNTNVSTNNGMSPFNILDPSDIESIEVLKDADATAIYGSRGANGVVLITTKKGKAGPTKIDANISEGWGKIDHSVPLLNTQQYLQLRTEAFSNDGVPLPTVSPTDFNYDIDGVWDKSRNTDWQKVFIGNTSKFTNSNLSISGGNTNTQFLLGGTYSRQTTVFPGKYSDQKASAHISLNHASNDQKFHVLFDGQYTNDQDLVPTLDFTKYIILAPDAPQLYNADGSINWQNGTFSQNPIASTLRQSQNSTNSLLSNLNLSYFVLPNVKLSSSFGYTRVDVDQTLQTPASSVYGPPIATNRSNFFATSNLNTWIIEPQISYNQQVGKGKIDILLGTTFQENKYSSVGQNARGFTSDALIPNVAAASNISFVGSNVTDYRYNALYARINYNWQEKYLLNLTARRDGSSRFGESKQWGNFGAIGAGWIFTKEKFLDSNDSWLSFGKLRASYGVTGNQPGTDYQYLSSYSTYSTSTYQGLTTLFPTRIANPYFSWELVRKLEGGLEFGILKDRIFLTTSLYRNRTDNQLVQYTIPSTTGFTSLQENLPATVQNTGIEFSINTINIKSNNFSWTSALNITIPRNKLVSFPKIANSTYNELYALGRPLSVQYLLHYTDVDPKTGLYTFEDVNKDGSIDDSDYKFVDGPSQKYFGGFSNSFNYKNFQLDVFVQFVKQTGFNYLNSIAVNGLGSQSIFGNLPSYVLDRWRKPGDVATVQRAFSGIGNDSDDAFYNMTTSDHIISDASFIRLKNVSISYSMPKSVLEKLRIKNARVYLQAQNLITITHYQGLDPETQGFALPPLRMITTGLQVSL